MVGLQTLDLAIGVRVPASQPFNTKHLRAALKRGRPFCVPLRKKDFRFGAVPQDAQRFYFPLDV